MGWGVGVVDIYYLITVPSIDTNYVSFTNTSMSLQHPPRPNIIFAVGQVARLPPPIHAPPKHTRTGWPLKAIIRYLKGTADQGLTHVTPTGDLQLDLYI